jgi:ADP-ribose pyrophosphatase YjhB (NUDIX family)/predicted transcriptional regulator
MQSLAKGERKQIFELFLENQRLKFSEIEKATKLRSNALAYHLEQMKKEGLLSSDTDSYCLTHKGEEVLPFFKQVTGQEVGLLTALLLCIVKGSKICLLKRNKKPYKDYWGLVGEKLQMHESIPDAAVRAAKEETSLDVKFDGICGVSHERTKEKDSFKHGFILFVVKCSVLNGEAKTMKEGEVKWFDLDKLDDEDIIPSDRWMIKNMLGKKINVAKAVLHDTDGMLHNLEAGYY